MQQHSNSYYGQPNGFSIRVDGKLVTFTTRVIALLDKRDITTELKKVGLTDAHIAFNRQIASMAKVPPMTKTQIKKLTEADLYGATADSNPGPMWQIQVNYIWKQRSPMNQVVNVHHEYRPFYTGGPGASYIDKEVAKRFCADKNSSPPTTRSSSPTAMTT